MSGKMLKINAELAYFTETFSELKNCQFKNSNMMFSSLQNTIVQTDDQQTQFRSSFRKNQLMSPFDSKSMNQMNSNQMNSNQMNSNQMNGNQINQLNNNQLNSTQPNSQINNQMIINLNRDVYFKNNQLNKKQTEFSDQNKFNNNNENSFNSMNINNFDHKSHPDNSTCESSESSTTSSNSSIVNSSTKYNLPVNSVGAICNGTGIPTA